MTTAAPTRAERLAFRKRVVAVASTRKRPPSLRAIPPPRGLVVEYTATLLRVSRELDAILAAALAGAGLRTDAADGDPPALDVLSKPQLTRALERARKAMEKATSRRSLAGAIDALGARTVRLSQSRWRAELQRAMGVTPTDVVPDLFVTSFRNRNLDLIRSLAGEKLVRARRIITERGTTDRVETLAQRIQEDTGATASRAALIARDQVLKLNGEIAQAQHEAAGIVEYTWSTSGDERVREGHRELDGTRQKYKEPPVVDPKSGRRANPGQDYSCRCVAIGIIPGLDD